MIQTGILATDIEAYTETEKADMNKCDFNATLNTNTLGDGLGGGIENYIIMASWVYSALLYREVVGMISYQTAIIAKGKLCFDMVGEVGYICVHRLLRIGGYRVYLWCL